MDPVPRDDAILAALAAGPRSSAALVATTGLGQRRCERGLRRLQDAGYVVSPVYAIYRLTDLGQTVLPDGQLGSAERPSTPPPARIVVHPAEPERGDATADVRSSVVVPAEARRPASTIAASPAKSSPPARSVADAARVADAAIAAWRAHDAAIAASRAHTASTARPAAASDVAPGKIAAGDDSPGKTAPAAPRDDTGGGVPTAAPARGLARLAFWRRSMSTPPANADGTIAEHRAERPDERDESDDDQHGEQGFNLDWIVGIVGIVAIAAIAGTGWLLRFLYIAGSSPVRPTPGPTQTEPPAVYDPYGLGLFPW